MSPYSNTGFEVFVPGREFLPQADNPALRERQPQWVVHRGIFLRADRDDAIEFTVHHLAGAAVVVTHRLCRRARAGRDRPAEGCLRWLFDCREIAEVHPQTFVARIGADDDVADF